MPHSSPPKAILFDLDGTLWDRNAAVRELLGEQHEQFIGDLRQIPAQQYVARIMDLEANGYADNVTFFTNVNFERPGAHIIQIYLDGNIAAERPIYVHHVPAPPKTVN